MASVALVGVGLAPDVFVVAACTALTYFGIAYGNGVREAVLVGAALMGTLAGCLNRKSWHSGSSTVSAAQEHTSWDA